MRTGAATGEKRRVASDEQGQVEAGGHKHSAVDPLVPVYGIVGDHFALSPDRWHRLLLHFRADELGKAAFDGEPLRLTGPTLVLNRYGSEIRFMRTRQ